MNSVDIQRFHRDLQAALAAEIPLLAGEDKRLTASELDRLQRQFAAIDDRSAVLASRGDAKISSEYALPQWYRAALNIFVQTDTMLPVLEGLSVRPLAIGRAVRAFRWTVIYLLILLTVAVLCLLLFQQSSGSAFEAFKQDAHNAAVVKSQSFELTRWLPVIVVALAVAVMSSWIWMLAGGIKQVALWFGGRKYVDYAASVAILRIAQLLVRGGVLAKEAILTGWQLTGSESRLLQQVNLLADGADNSNAIEQLTDSLELNATKQLNRLRLITPFSLLAVVGGGVVLFYCLLIFWPIVSLFEELWIAG